METTIKLDRNTSKAIHKLEHLEKLTMIGIRKAFHKIGKDLKQSGEKALLYRPKSGRLYKIKINGITYNHRASAPGESPANLTGALRKSLDYKVSGAREMRWEAGNSTVNYAADLEFGTSRIKPRPYMERAIKENRRDIGNHFLREIKKSTTCK